MKCYIRSNIGRTRIKVLLVVLILFLSLIVATMPCMVDSFDWARSVITRIKMQTIARVLRLCKHEGLPFPQNLDFEYSKRCIWFSSWPINDGWGNEFYYSPESGNSPDFKLMSPGKDGKRGGQGYDRDLYIHELKLVGWFSNCK